MVNQKGGNKPRLPKKKRSKQYMKERDEAVALYLKHVLN